MWFHLAETDGGVTALLPDRPFAGGPVGQPVGLGLVAVSVVAVPDVAPLSRWRDRSRGTTPVGLVRATAPPVVPALLLTLGTR